MKTKLKYIALIAIALNISGCGDINWFPQPPPSAQSSTFNSISSAKVSNAVSVTISDAGKFVKSERVTGTKMWFTHTSTKLFQTYTSAYLFKKNEELMIRTELAGEKVTAKELYNVNGDICKVYVK